MSYFNKLLEISSKPILTSISSKYLLENKNSERISELKEILNIKNGFYAFEGALHFFSDNEHKNYQIWKDSYKGLADNLLCFAEDAFGNQFCIKDNAIYFFDSETANIEFLAHNFEEWAKIILNDYNFYTAFPIMHEWQSKNGVLPLNHRLVPKKPFILGGEYNINNLYNSDSIKSMQFRGEIADRIKNLPDGSKLTLKIIE